eukprot:395068_1
MAQRRASTSKPKAEVMIISDLLSMVRLPPQTDINEWYAVHMVQFYNELSLVCGIIRHDNIICNERTCPKMCAGIDFEYLWHSREFIQLIPVSAPKYIDFLLEWIEELINDKKQFPRLINEEEEEYSDVNDNDDGESENNDSHNHMT